MKEGRNDIVYHILYVALGWRKISLSQDREEEVVLCIECVYVCMLPGW